MTVKPLCGAVIKSYGTERQSKDVVVTISGIYVGDERRQTIEEVS
jgi:hypothetical protein